MGVIHEPMENVLVEFSRRLRVTHNNLRAWEEAVAKNGSNLPEWYFDEMRMRQERYRSVRIDPLRQGKQFRIGGHLVRLPSMKLPNPVASVYQGKIQHEVRGVTFRF